LLHQKNTPITDLVAMEHSSSNNTKIKE